jgi:hypothetical protein
MPTVIMWRITATITHITTSVITTDHTTSAAVV